jgi:hypothetical protein
VECNTRVKQYYFRRRKKKLENTEHYNIYFLAETLHKTVSELNEIPYEEFIEWMAYFHIKHDKMKKEENEQKIKNRPVKSKRY